MSQGRGHFVCGAIFGIALGFAVGHLMVRARTPRNVLSVSTGLLPSPGDVATAAAPASSSGSIFDRYPAGRTDGPALSRSVITADAFRKDDAGSVSVPLPQEPSPLPRVEALPIPPDSKPAEANSTDRKSEEELRKLLDEELQAASPQQREIWKDALDGVPSGDAAEILRMWKTMGTGPAPGGPPSGLSAIPEPSGLTSLSPPLPSPSPYYPSPASSCPLSASSGPTGRPMVLPPSGGIIAGERLRTTHPTAWRQLRRDLAHAETPGYLRSVPELANADDGPSGPRFRVAALRTDFVPGKLIQTDSMCDVALRGSGFFSITTEKGLALTRLGRLGLDAERRLGVRLGNSVAPLSPEIRIPADAAGLKIAGDGSVSLLQHGGVPSESLGKIEPVVVLDPSQLAAVETLASVFIATPQSGSPQKVSSDGFTLEQFALQQSNVDPDETRRWIERLEMLAVEGALLGD